MVVNVCSCLCACCAHEGERGSVESALAWLGTTGKKTTLQPVVSSGSNLDHRIYSPARTADDDDDGDDDVELHVPPDVG